MSTARQIAQGNKNLLDLAAYVERRQRAHPRYGYRQYSFTHYCGSPGCLLGHEMHRGNISKDAWIADPVVLKRYAIDSRQAEILFGLVGCDDAQHDWRKAVQFVRDFVAKRTPQR